MAANHFIKEEDIVIILDPNDAKAVRNKNNLLRLYQELVNEHRGAESTSKYCVPGYIQHNPWIPTTAAGTAAGFEKLYSSSIDLHVVIYRMIAVGDYVWSHGHFIGFDHGKGLGRAVIDIFLFNEDGMVVEHWDAEQQVEDASTAANDNGMFETLYIKK